MELSNKNIFVKKKKTNKVWWLEGPGTKGEMIFSFDRKKSYNLFADYPDAMTAEEVEIFDRENPFWAEFFAERRNK